MNFEKEVCSLEDAQKLKHLGFNNDYIYCYYKSYDTAGAHVEENITLTFKLGTTGFLSAWPAYTARELGEALPALLIINDHKYHLKIEKVLVRNVEKLNVGEVWYFNYHDNEDETLFPRNIIAEKEADGRAQCLIQLIECGFMKVDV